MRKIATLLVVLVMMVLACSSDSVKSSDLVKLSFETAVNKYWTAFESKNWDKAVSYFFSAKIVSLGGLENAKVAMKNAMAPLKIVSSKIENIQIYHDKGDIYIGVANLTFEADRENQMNGKVYQLKSETGLIGHTDNSGKTWHFIGVTPAERNILGAISPDLFQSLDIPQEKIYVKEDGEWNPLDS